MDAIKLYRDMFFSELGKSRVSRILVVTFMVCIIWIIADLVSNNLGFNIMHDIGALIIGIVIELIIPWGKTSQIEEELRTSNRKLRETLKEATNMLSILADNYEFRKKVEVNQDVSSSNDGYSDNPSSDL